MFFSAFILSWTLFVSKKVSSLFSKKCFHSLFFLHFLKISLASFLNTSFVYPFFHPFFFLSLLDSLLFVSSSWIVLSSFFFHLLFHHFSHCSLCFVFLLLFGAHFSCSLSFLLVAIVVCAFFFAFRIYCFLVFSTPQKNNVFFWKTCFLL